ncbi:MAG: hypothetical protein OXC91_01830 [Rhodobacteraceae bacterium]|nr:hypothetical protein [Paracoccaceae bacterium]
MTTIVRAVILAPARASSPSTASHAPPQNTDGAGAHVTLFDNAMNRAVFVDETQPGWRNW